MCAHSRLCIAVSLLSHNFNFGRTVATQFDLEANSCGSSLNVAESNSLVEEADSIIDVLCIFTIHCIMDLTTKNKFLVLGAGSGLEF